MKEFLLDPASPEPHIGDVVAVDPASGLAHAITTPPGHRLVFEARGSRVFEPDRDPVPSPSPLQNIMGELKAQQVRALRDAIMEALTEERPALEALVAQQVAAAVAAERQSLAKALRKAAEPYRHASVPHMPGLGVAWISEPGAALLTLADELDPRPGA